MCDILKYLHSQEPPVVHRDFTPDNIILQPDGRLKLIDFSVAQHKKDPNSSDCGGKHSYTPPEQFRGAASPQSDRYALGATLYFLATGIYPVPISTSHLPATDSESTNILNKIISALQNWIYTSATSQLTGFCYRFKSKRPHPKATNPRCRRSLLQRSCIYPIPIEDLASKSIPTKIKFITQQSTASQKVYKGITAAKYAG
jgi:serine/threonine protein kinase